ncbi:MAG: hypothetical protein AB8C84_06700 [Oligoflexales bacterium]
MKKNKQSGQSVIEYILISLFTIFTSLATLKLSFDLLENKTHHLVEKLGVDASAVFTNPFEE